MKPIDNIKKPKKTTKKPAKKAVAVQVTAKPPRYNKLFVFASLAVLFSTTILWSLLSARLQQSNADQLVNPLLFENSKTFNGAFIPSTHSFLLKWPIFLLIKLFGFSNNTYAVFTVITVLATVAALVFILYKIEKRPIIFGTLCLALASVLLLVPPQPYAGGLLPVNMAMVATRNLEYIFYIASLYLIIKSQALRGRKFWLGIALMGLLMASDHLFIFLALGGSIIPLMAYSLRNRWDMVVLSVKSLVGVILAAMGAVILIPVLNLINLANFSNGSNIGLYGSANGIKNLVLGLVYGVASLFTNLGANPAYSSTIVKNIPHQATKNLLSLGGPAYFVNLIIFAFGLYCIWILTRSSFVIKKSKKKLLADVPMQLSMILVWSTLSALVVFIASNHYYAVDSRYLGISLFAIFISAATFTGQHKKLTIKWFYYAAGICTLSIVFGIIAFAKNYQTNNSALADINERNHQVAQVLKSHPTDVLVGDYWRVIPTKLAAKNKINILPLANCTDPRDTLSSANWQLDLHKHSFAYLISFDKSLADFPACTIKEAVGKYGKPNASVLISGTLSQPKEMLLFYDSGIHQSQNSSVKSSAISNSTILPISLDDIPGTTCSVPTSMDIVAHEDDDLLFMNPDILHDIKNGHCVRTIYITAGDAGAGEFYWLSRQQGAEAAYSQMSGSSPLWIQRIVKLNDNEYITIANPKNNPKISLIFINLPDGNLGGNGFPYSSHESLLRLQLQYINTIHSVDRQSSYSSTELVSALVSLMYKYQPTTIRAQATEINKDYADHSDHMIGGQYAKLAYDKYEDEQFSNQVVIPFKFYIGYPIHSRPENVFGKDLSDKESAFFQYAKFDGAVCDNIDKCNKTSPYGFYLTRQYTQ